MREIHSPTGLHPAATTADAWLHYRIHETPEDLAVLTPRVAQESEIWIDTETADWNTKSPRLSLVQLRLGDGSLHVLDLSPEMTAGVSPTASAPSGLLGKPVLRPKSRDGSIEQCAIRGHQAPRSPGAVGELGNGDNWDSNIAAAHGRQALENRRHLVHGGDGYVRIEDGSHSSGTERSEPRRRASARNSSISSVVSPSQGPISAKSAAAERLTGRSGTTRTSIIRPSTMARTGWPGSRLSCWSASSIVFSTFTSLIVGQRPRSQQEGESRLLGETVALGSTAAGPEVGGRLVVDRRAADRPSAFDLA